MNGPPTPPSSPRALGARVALAMALGVASAAGGLLAPACSDSIHLLPVGGPDGGTTTSTTSTGSAGGGGEGGGAPVACISNADCPAPEAVCDPARGLCVECLVLSDCAFRPETVCSEGQCVCPLATETFCDATRSCEDLDTSSQACGDCNRSCFGTCLGGTCLDAWEPTPTSGAPSSRVHHVAVSTGDRMLVWGGAAPNYTNTGGVFDVETRTWSTMAVAGAPAPRGYARAVWTGTEMLVWGGIGYDGLLADGGRFDPARNAWTPMSNAGAPAARYLHSAVWLGGTAKRLVVWGGYTAAGNTAAGALYDPATDTWEPLPEANVTQRREHVAVAADDRMVLFGGIGFDGTTDEVFLGTAGAFVGPPQKAWLDPPTVDGGPGPRIRHTVVWTGAKVIVWSGNSGAEVLSAGAALDVASGAWSPVAPLDAREFATAVWIGSTDGGRMYVFGGSDPGGVFYGSGAAYDPNANAWVGIPTGPAARRLHTAVVVGGKMLVWGGQLSGGGYTNTGGIFDPAFNY